MFNSEAMWGTSLIITILSWSAFISRKLPSMCWRPIERKKTSLRWSSSHKFYLLQIKDYLLSSRGGRKSLFVNRSAKKNLGLPRNTLGSKRWKRLWVSGLSSLPAKRSKWLQKNSHISKEPSLSSEFSLCGLALIVKAMWWSVGLKR